MVDLTRGIPAAADFDHAIGRCDRTRGMGLFGTAVAEREIAIGDGGDRKTRADREVKRPRQNRDTVPPFAEALPVARARIHFEDAAKRHDAELVVGSLAGTALARRQFARLESEIVETRLPGFDLHSGVLRRYQQTTFRVVSGHQFQDTVFRCASTFPAWRWRSW